MKNGLLFVKLLGADLAPCRVEAVLSLASKSRVSTMGVNTMLVGDAVTINLL
jgi:hypothetical protein